MIRRAVLYLLLLFLILTQSLWANDLEERTVRVRANLGRRTSYGTGFFWQDSSHVVTAYHVVMGADSIEIIDGGNKYEDIVVEAASGSHDLVLLRIEDSDLRSRAVPMQGVPTSSVRVFSPATVVAYPHNSAQPHTFLANPTKRYGDSSKGLRDRESRSYFYENIRVATYDLTIFSGMSGAPVFEGGEIVAVVSGSITEGGSLVWAVPLFYLSQLEEYNSDPDRMDWPELSLMNAAVARRIVFGGEPPPPEYSVTVSAGQNVLTAEEAEIPSANDKLDLFGRVAFDTTFYRFNLRAGARVTAHYFQYRRSYQTLPGLSSSSETVDAFALAFGASGGYVVTRWRLQPYLGLSFAVPLYVAGDAKIFPLISALELALRVSDRFSAIAEFALMNYAEQNIDFDLYGNSSTRNDWALRSKLFLGISFSPVRGRWE